MSTLNSFKRGKQSFFIPKNSSLEVIQLHITYRCNLKCKFCWLCDGGNKDLQEELSDKRIIELTRESCLFNLKQFIISGVGEPLIRKNVVLRMMSLIKNSKIKKGILITNGTLIDSDFARGLVNMGWDKVEFSMHAPFKKTDAFLRGSSKAFDQSIKGIKAIVDQKEKTGSTNPVLVFKTIVNKNNHKHLYSMLHLAKKLRMNGMQIRLLSGRSPFCEKARLGQKEKLHLLHELEKYKSYCKKEDMSFYVEFPLSELIPNNNRVVNDKQLKENKPFCRVPFHKLLICHNGIALPCCGFFGCQFEKKAAELEMVEDVSNKSIKEIFYGKKFTNFRQKFLSDKPLEQCISCPPDLQNIRTLYHKFSVPSSDR